MVAKNHRQWLANPPLASDEWVDSRIYSDPGIFEEELERIFKRTWIPVCHESELTEALRFPHDQLSLASPSSCAAGPTMKYARF